jgi:hypothetical protein
MKCPSSAEIHVQHYSDSHTSPLLPPINQ